MICSSPDSFQPTKGEVIKSILEPETFELNHLVNIALDLGLLNLEINGGGVLDSHSRR